MRGRDCRCPDRDAERRLPVPSRALASGVALRSIPAQRSGGRLRVDAAVTFAGQAAIGGLNFVAALAIARALGPTGRGSVAVALALVTGLVQLGSLGITAATPCSDRQGQLARRALGDGRRLVGSCVRRGPRRRPVRDQRGRSVPAPGANVGAARDRCRCHSDRASGTFPAEHPARARAGTGLQRGTARFRRPFTGRAHRARAGWRTVRQPGIDRAPLAVSADRDRLPGAARRRTAARSSAEPRHLAEAARTGPRRTPAQSCRFWSSGSICYS